MRRRTVRHLHARNDSGGCHLLNRKPEPTIDEIREGLSGNLCRCTGYSQIIEAVADAARRRTHRMRSNPSDYEMVAPDNLQAVVSLLAQDPGMWLPIAGGTDVMVQYAAGRLAARKLVSIWNLPELRRIEVTTTRFGSARDALIPTFASTRLLGANLLSCRVPRAWTGGIANQNRGTIGGNIVNASPAADSLPALLVYDAELILVSAPGERRVAYARFHTGYKKTLLAPDELIQAICLPRRFSGYFSHARKVGARNAQAISKVCIAALGRIRGGVVEDVRIALGSVAPVPLRLTETEQAVMGKAIDSDLLLLAKKAAAAEIRPIDDIRSSARYRATVAGNLVVEFLDRLRSTSAESNGSKDVLTRWNHLPPDEAVKIILPCCGSKAWAEGMLARRPFPDEAALLVASSEVWRSLIAIRLDGSIPESSANRRVAPGESFLDPVGACPVCRMVGAGATEGRRCQKCGEDCSGGGESRIRASLSIVSLLCAQRVNRRRRFWRFCSDG
jgi:xanthine dehydrogenase iron-sulfur cluster and FAD-binding subunit A